MKMFISKYDVLLSSVLSVLLCELVFCQRNVCSDCTKVNECSQAFQLLADKSIPSEDIKKLRAAQCGYEGRTPKLCCLDFHPNLNLLPKECGFIDANRIVGGKETGLWEYPWMTLISYNTAEGLKFKCGGTVINERYILTAAHCLQDQKIAGVRIGEHDIRTDMDCQGNGPATVDCEDKLQDIRIEEVIIHEEYKGRPIMSSDIGLLRLVKPVTFAKNAQPICLPVTTPLRERDTANLNSTIAGWGYTEEGYTSPVLLSASVAIYSDANCKGLYNRGSGPGMDTTLNKLCAGGSGKDSCGGDSGGPLMLQGVHRNVDRLIQYGIVSYGPKLCGSSFPGVYTDVTKFMKWILDHLKP